MSDEFMQSRNYYYLKTGKENLFVFFYYENFECVVVRGEVESKAVNLGYATGKILEALLRSPDNIITREEMFTIAWPGRVVTQNSLNQAISSLRNLLEDDESIIIKTVSRRGYVFNSECILEKFNRETIGENHTHIEVDNCPGNTGATEACTPDNNLSARFKNAEINYRPTIGLSPLFKIISVVTLILLAMSFFVRLYHMWDESHWYAMRKVEVDSGEILYIAENDASVKSSESATKSIVSRFVAQSNGDLFLLVNKMHSYYDFICMKKTSAPKFILVHESVLAKISESNIAECLQ